MSRTLKAIIAAMIALALTLMGISSATAAPPAPTAAGRNVALASEGATVAASGVEVEGRNPPDAVIDGSRATRWSSNTADDAWIAVKLAQPTKVDHVTIAWETACAARYHLEVSADGKTWQRATDTISPKCGAEDTQKLNSATNQQAWQYVKMQAEDRTPFNGVKYGVSMFEFEIWDGPLPKADTSLSLVPLPASVNDKSKNEDPFVLTPSSRIIASKDASGPASLLARQMRLATGFKLPLASGDPNPSDVVLADGSVKGMDSSEAYALTTSANGARITAPSAHGFFNGAQTLLQLFPSAMNGRGPAAGPWAAPAVEIKDAPRYSMRSLMIDPARSFLTVTEVKEIIDQMASLKMSALHIHLADDQGWRIEITNDGKEAGDPIDYTQLTRKSGKTAMVVHEKQASHEVGRTGFYTQADYRDIVSYASERFITVIPEIDTPGHVNAILHAIPQLNTAGSSHTATDEEPTAPANGTGAVGWSYLDPDSDLTYTFIKHVFSQLAAMTPGPRMHIGGDEVHAFTQRYGVEKFNSTLTRILGIVRDLGKTPIGWSEISTTKLSENDGIHYWIGYEKSIAKSTQSGAKVIMSRAGSSYIDQKYNPKTPLGLTWACHSNCTLRAFYDWDPATTIDGVTDANILGPEVAQWSETIRGGDQAEFLMWPRAAAHAEVGWTPQKRRNTDDFLRRIGGIGPRWTYTGQNFYDTAEVAWAYDVSSPATLSAPPGKSVTFPLGSIAAPGTHVTGRTLSADDIDDADGVSRSRISPSTAAVIDWGDGSPTTEATLRADHPRSAYNAPSLYHVLGQHTYAKSGQYDATITVDERSTRVRISVSSDAQSPALPSEWNPDTAPSARVSPTKFPTDSRVGVTISGFQPNVPVDMIIDDENIGQLRPDDSGQRSENVFIPLSVLQGTQKWTFKQGKRVATVEVTVTRGAIKLENPLPTGALSVHAKSSEETSGEKAPAPNAIDGDRGTFWHTKWSGSAAKYPHFIELELPADKVCKVTGFEYTPRQDSENTRVKDYRISVSDDAKSWTEVYSGKFRSGANSQAVNFPKDSRRNAKFVRMDQLSSQNGQNFGGAAEIRVGAVCEDQPNGRTGDFEAQNNSHLTYPKGNLVFPGNDGKSHKVSFDKNSFMIDGQRLNIWSGEFHYWRLPDENGWRDIFQKMRANGYNAVSLYFFWGLHQSSKDGSFDFSPDSIKDIDKLLTIAEEEGLYVIARPGPYVNAEISMGGLPAYMTNYSGALRSTDPESLKASTDWLTAFNSVAKKHLITDGGGSIILYQVENELPAEHKADFLKALVAQVKKDGITVPLFHNDYNLGGRFKDHQQYGTDFYAYDKYPVGFNCSAPRQEISDSESKFRSIAPDTPHFITESQGGAFTPWGATYNASDCYTYTDGAFTRQWGVTNIGNGVTAFNFYMGFGGTNWGWTGSPSSGFTSYDYGAGITEDRTLTPKASVQKEIGYYERAVPSLGAMDPDTAPKPKDVNGAPLRVYSRVASDPAGSATGTGTRVLAVRHASSNAEDTTTFSLPLRLGKASASSDQSQTIDDRAEEVSLRGAWKRISDGTAMAGTISQSSTNGDTARLSFTGTGVSVVVGTGTDHGAFSVQIDDRDPVSVDSAHVDSEQNKPTQLVAFSVDDLPAGDHTITVTNKGSGAGSLLSLDGFKVTAPQSQGTLHNDSDTDFLKFTGSWQHASGKSWTSGDIQGDETYSSKAGDKVGFTFTGIGFDVIGPFSENHGSATVYVDGKKVGPTQEQVTDSAQPQQTLFSWRDETTSPSEHSVEIVVDGKAFPGSSGTFVSIDAIRHYTDKASLPQVDDGGPRDGEIGWSRIPQKEGTSLTLHGRDALLLTADMKIAGKELYYTTSQLFGEPIPGNDTTTQYLVGHDGDAGETVLHFAEKPQVNAPSGVEVNFDAKSGELRLNYTHRSEPQDIAVISAGKRLTLRVIDREFAQTTWLIHGMRGSETVPVAVEGVELARTANFSGDTLAVTGSASEPSQVRVQTPNGIAHVTWNGAALNTTAQEATGEDPGPFAFPARELKFVKAKDDDYASKGFDDSAWIDASDTKAANPRQQGPGSKQGVVLDSNHYDLFEGSVWYRAHYRSKDSNPRITLQGNGGTGQPSQGRKPAFMQVWANGTYAGALPADGGSHEIQLSNVSAGEDVVLAVVVHNLGQNLDWSDNGLSKQNRGLFDADLKSEGAVKWKITGATPQDAMKNNPSGTLYNKGGLRGESLGWHMPSFDDASWAPTDSLHSDPGITWYRSTFDLKIPKAQDIAFRLDINSRRAPRADHSQATIFVNGWNTGVYIGDIGPQTSFTVPQAFLNLSGKNTVAIAAAAKEDDMGPESVTLRAAHMTTLPDSAATTPEPTPDVTAEPTPSPSASAVDTPSPSTSGGASETPGPAPSTNSSGTPSAPGTIHPSSGGSGTGPSAAPGGGSPSPTRLPATGVSAGNGTGTAVGS